MRRLIRIGMVAARSALHGFLGGGVTFCQLVPMRSIPFKIPTPADLGLPPAATAMIELCLMNIVPGICAAAVDVPYEKDSITAALVQGAYGSNKDSRDFGFLGDRERGPLPIARRNHLGQGVFRRVRARRR